jgi:hypothetical protein
LNDLVARGNPGVSITEFRITENDVSTSIVTTSKFETNRLGEIDLDVFFLASSGVHLGCGLNLGSSSNTASRATSAGLMIKNRDKERISREI